MDPDRRKVSTAKCRLPGVEIALIRAARGRVVGKACRRVIPITLIHPSYAREGPISHERRVLSLILYLPCR